MGEDLGRKLGGMFRGLRQKAEDAVTRSETAFVRGKIAGSPVLDDQGGMIVDAGRLIDDSVIDRAARAGKLHALAKAAGAAQLQDLKEKASEQIAATEGGQESRSLDSVDDYVAARRYVGWTTAFDVTDIRGNLVVPTGKEVTEEDVRRCREAGLLSALVYAAQRGSRPDPNAAPKSSTDPGYVPKLHAPGPGRPTLPMMSPDSKDEG